MQINLNEVPSDILEVFSRLQARPSYSRLDTIQAVKDRAFAVTKVTALDMIETIRQTLEQGLKEGLNYEKFLERVNLALTAKGFNPNGYRWDVIYRTNIKTVFERGRFERMAGVSDIFPYRRFVAVEDERTTETCREMNGIVVHWTSDVYMTNQTPRHFNCRSTWVLEKEPAKNTPVWEKMKFQPAEGFGTFELPKEYISQYQEQLNAYTLNNILKSENPIQEWLSRNEFVEKFEPAKILSADEFNQLVETYTRRASAEVKQFVEDLLHGELAAYNKYFRTGDVDKTGLGNKWDMFLDQTKNLRLENEVTLFRGLNFSDLQSMIKYLELLKTGVFDIGLSSMTINESLSRNFLTEGKYSILITANIQKGSRFVIGSMSDGEIFLLPNTRISLKQVASEKIMDREVVVIKCEVWNE